MTKVNSEKQYPDLSQYFKVATTLVRIAGIMYGIYLFFDLVHMAKIGGAILNPLKHEGW